MISFVRHGCTDFNVEKRLQGHMDVPLNELGRKQALLTAQRLAGESWDVLISSDLSRARETAEVISQETKLPIIKLDQRLREMNMGQLSGTTEAERIERWGEGWRTLDLQGESVEQLRNRGLEAVRAIAETYQGKKVIAVSHGGLIRQIILSLFKHEQLPVLHNGSMTTMTCREGKWELLLYNCTRHLMGMTEK